MFTLSNFILVGIGAAIGAWLRWLITYFFTIADPTLPHGTLAVNLIGGLIIGMSFAAIQSTAFEISEEIKLILNVGFLGAFTTFSTYSVELLNLFLKGEVALGIFFAVLNVIGALLFCFIGWYLFNLFLK
ncbi:MAG: fluoride efflux transporter CrcB [Nitrosomonadales bacterium]|jgi:CrcB protein|nr:fluoride efflux transporter CrcB [Nitrosomonadales bacterium]MBT3917782.1 fluoride efflux transporter CrcB [Nitrosomonadales bacterium]MBT4183607.1 fluoride efflux transporter CrcB [Nitrosomonadales bacterium]MBT4571305.1 fluoride efflux transporter CrcB [Nitrosomonadales bacterium]MBT4759494.1 fluoride efflux transporter CrcB [Nitrosomonadales bacterium]